MKKTLFLSICWLLFSFGRVFAQQDAQFTQFMFNQLFINPAYAGVEDLTHVSLIHRTQWLGYTSNFDDGGSPNTQVFSFTTGLPKFNSGIGFHFVHDRLGPLTNIEAQLSYAYHLKLKGNAKLSFGFRGGIYTKVIAFDRLRFREDNDPFDVSGREGSLKPDLAAGIYYHSKKIFLGLSANHLIKLDFNFGDITEKPLANSYYLMGGYHIQANRDWIVTPMLFVKSSEFNEISFDVGLMANYNNKFWVGSTYRNEESANLIVGLLVPKKDKKSKGDFKISYAFDYVIAGQTAKNATSHELVLSYSLPVPVPKIPAIIRTPRFRY